MLVLVRRVRVDGCLMWRCRCDCGKRINVRAGHLVRAIPTRSCGCFRAAKSFTHGSSKTSLYGIWLNMKARCLNASNPSYPEYGGRGIRIAEAWLAFASFEEAILRTIGQRPSPRHSIDRIDVDGDYAEGNVRWSTQRGQQNNRRNNRRIEHDGKTLTLAEWARATGVEYGTLWSRLNRGASFVDAIAS